MSASRRSPVPLACLVGLCILSGCSGRPSLLPNSDPSLNKTSAQFAADAAKRYPFNTALPSGGVAKGRAQVGYGLDTVEVVNLSDEDWNNVEIWINRNYVVAVPRIEAGGKRVKTLNFQMFYDARGHSFPLDNHVPERMVRQLEMVRGGQLYSIPVTLAD
jgi:hypothetical protein